MIASLSDWLALPRYLLAALPWWVWPLLAGVLWFTAGGLRAALRLLLFLIAVLGATVWAVSSWLTDHPETVTGPAQVVEVVVETDRVAG